MTAPALLSVWELRHIADVQRGEVAQFPMPASISQGRIRWFEPLTVVRVSQPFRSAANAGDWLVEYEPRNADDQRGPLLIIPERCAFHGARVRPPAGGDE